MIRIRALSAAPRADDGRRVLITRYRPRFVRKGEESWAEWDKRLAPSVALLDAAFGKRREGGRVVARGLPPLPWEEFAARYREEMQAPPATAALAALRDRSVAGETLTLLCYCADEERCHRSLARDLLLEG